MRAKFNVVKVVKEPYGEEVTLSAVYSAENNTEDNQFAAATPAGHLQITVTNPKAIGYLEEGESYYLDFSKAPTQY
jgi:hypothetical protein